MKEIVLITGPAGFVGFKTVLVALQANYRVRAVIRKAEQAEKIRSNAKIAPFAKHLEFVVVPDLTQRGAFDDLLLDVVAVLHIASPTLPDTTEYERDILRPAVDMSTSILYSALEAPSIRRVIITSSMITLAPFEWLANPDSKRLYTARDLDDNPNRPSMNGMEAYWTSKTRARIAVTNFLKTEKPHFEIIQMIPGAIGGPDDRATSTADLFNGTPLFPLRMAPVLREKPEAAVLISTPIDVGDVAKAHVGAIRSTVPGNVNYILSSDAPEGIDWNSMIDIAKKYWPERVGSKEFPLGGSLATLKWRVDAAESERAFGWKFVSFEESTKAMIGQYLGFVDAEKK